jgi:hypothetical protein
MLIADFETSNPRWIRSAERDRLFMAAGSFFRCGSVRASVN